MKSLASKLCKIMSECAYVQKDGRNEFHRYNYASAANVLEKVNESCVKHNVASFPVYEIISDKERTTSKGGTESLVTVQAKLTIIDGDSGDMLTAVALGSGQDAGDKAVAKAQTMALKYAWMTTLNISTGDDPEADEETDKRNAERSKPAVASKPQAVPAAATAQPAATSQLATEPQRKRMFAMCKQLSWDAETIKRFVNENTGKTSSKELTQTDVQNLFVMLEELIKAKEEQKSA
jgi:hypothetical protein